jgi:hypothetical protein
MRMLDVFVAPSQFPAPDDMDKVLQLWIFWLQDWSIFPISRNSVYRFQSSPSTFLTFILVYRHANHARQETPVLLCVLLKITAGRQLSRGFFSLILEFRSELGSLSF